MNTQAAPHAKIVAALLEDSRSPEDAGIAGDPLDWAFAMAGRLSAITDPSQYPFGLPFRDFALAELQGSKIVQHLVDEGRSVQDEGSATFAR